MVDTLSWPHTGTRTHLHSFFPHSCVNDSVQLFPLIVVYANLGKNVWHLLDLCCFNECVVMFGLCWDRKWAGEMVHILWNVIIFFKKSVYLEKKKFNTFNLLLVFPGEKNRMTNLNSKRKIQKHEEHLDPWMWQTLFKSQGLIAVSLFFSVS